MTVREFVTEFWATFCAPLIDVLKSVDVLGFSLWNWFMGFALAGLAVRLFRFFFKHSDDDSK